MSDAVSGTVLRDILAGCEGVAPGPWERRADPSHYDSVTDIYAQGFIIAQTCGKSFDGMEARAAHIARLDPQTIASIVSELIARREADEWQDIRTALKDGKTIIWACFRDDLEPEGRWSGRQLPLCHSGYTDSGLDIGWHVAAPVGQGGFPDHWIAGWRPLPQPPLSTNEPKP
jgi:hypothetical protein